MSRASGLAAVSDSPLSSTSEQNLAHMDQLRTDDTRVEELSAAVERLAAALGPGIERPARHERPARDDPSGPAASTAPDG